MTRPNVAAENGRPDALDEAKARAREGSALYVWRLDKEHPWRITDWDGVPDDIEETSDLARVDLHDRSAEAKS